ncbi:MAG: hypothetical protein IPJ66_10810 [Bacteroidetes bacterium]|nr:hypothetical protein [Bacteroidota bacterium]
MVASSAGASADNIAPGTPVTLNVNGGTLGTGASWKWYTTSCGGTSIGSGSSLIVTPQITTTYFVRAEGVCNSTACVSVTVTLIPSVICQAPTSVNSSAGVTVCSGTSTTLSLVGGILPTGGVWRWYKGGCGLGTVQVQGPEFR